MLYFVTGEHLNDNNQRVISVNTSTEDLGGLLATWLVRLMEWKNNMEELRDEYDVLTYFTVNDMRHLLKLLQDYIKEQHDHPCEGTSLTKLSAKISFIDHTITYLRHSNIKHEVICAFIQYLKEQQFDSEGLVDDIIDGDEDSNIYQAINDESFSKSLSEHIAESQSMYKYI